MSNFSFGSIGAGSQRDIGYGNIVKSVIDKIGICCTISIIYSFVECSIILF